MNRLRVIWLVVGLVVGLLVSRGFTPAPLAPVDATSLTSVTERIHHMASTGASIELSTHAKQRMNEREMSLADIRTVLERGVIKHPPRRGDKGDLIYKLEDEDTRGTKDGEVVVIPRENSLFIVTVMWDGAE